MIQTKAALSVFVGHAVLKKEFHLESHMEKVAEFLKSPAITAPFSLVAASLFLIATGLFLS